MTGRASGMSRTSSPATARPRRSGGLELAIGRLVRLHGGRLAVFPAGAGQGDHLGLDQIGIAPAFLPDRVQVFPPSDLVPRHPPVVEGPAVGGETGLDIAA